MRWAVRRLLFGERRRSDRVLNDAKSALARLDRALASVEQATVEHDKRDHDDRL